MSVNELRQHMHGTTGLPTQQTAQTTAHGLRMCSCTVALTVALTLSHLHACWMFWWSCDSIRGGVQALEHASPAP